MEYFTTRDGVKVPKLIYGTAWKKEQTAKFVELAIKNGFRGVDTAGQPKHYDEARVGLGLKNAYQHGIKREDLFIQTKFTPIRGQDPDNIPYNPEDSFRDQVLTSFASSQKNLNTELIDSLVLHSPLDTWDNLMEVWMTMESLVKEGKVRALGISNCYQPELFFMLFEKSSVRPSFLQNRFYQDSGYDQELRKFCLNNDVIYQSFWTLTANPHVLKNEAIKEIAKEKNVNAEQVLFRFLNKIGIAPLTGTTNEVHMKEDLNIFNFDLDEKQCQKISSLFS